MVCTNTHLQTGGVVVEHGELPLLHHRLHDVFDRRAGQAFCSRLNVLRNFATLGAATAMQ